MVIYKNKCYATCSDYPDSDFMGNADYVVADDSEIAHKIMSFTNFDFILDGDGNLADIVETEPQPEPEKPPEPPSCAELAAAIAELAEVMFGG